MARTKRTYLVTIEGDSEGKIGGIDSQEVFGVVRDYLAIPPMDITVHEIKANIDVQDSGHPKVKRKPNPKVHASKGMDLDDALAIASQEPMTEQQRQQRDLLINLSIDAGIPVSTLARKSNLSEQSIRVIRRERNRAASRV